MSKRYGAAPDLCTEEFSREFAKLHYFNRFETVPRHYIDRYIVTPRFGISFQI
jgi:hypothetical protein